MSEVTPSNKGIALVPGTVVELALDGTVVYVENVSNSYAAVVALPDQTQSQAGRADDRVFTPGRVGAKKLSPFAGANRIIEVPDLSQRNREFIGTYETLRAQHGPNYVDQTEEERAAMSVKKVKPDKETRRAEREAKRAEKKAEREAAKQARKEAQQPRMLQRCQTCNEQPGHPNHPGDHEFVPPPEEPATPKAPKPRAAKNDLPAGPFRWVGTTDQLNMLAAMNPKYKPNNSGTAIIEAIRAKLDDGATLDDVKSALAAHPKWNDVPEERVKIALTQLLNAKLVEVVA
jgi:hypothetical protein